MDRPDNGYHGLAVRLADSFARFPQVEAVAWAGSLTAGSATDRASDIDLYVYITRPIPLKDRLDLVEDLGGASRADMDLDFWGPGDEWFDASTGIEVDVMYWEPGWMEGMLDRVLEQHRASLGYTTCFWHTLLTSQILFDRSGWLARLKQNCDRPYPEELRRAIINFNRVVLRDVIPGYRSQVEKALKRADLVSINHRVSALVASYFDILFAFNRVPHPGEKRLIEQAECLCPRLPPDMAAQVETVLRCAGDTNPRLVEEIDRLVDELEAFLAGD
jgi:predicted nucleotidyltransferase